MHSVIIDSSQLGLPREFAKKFKGKKVALVETKDGVLIKSVTSPLIAARGILKGKFSTEEYFKMKAEDKELER